MKGGHKTSGFTIVETLIVLAVTGGLFVAVALTLSGRQQRAQFEQAIQEIKSQIQQNIDEVATGFYPNLNNFTCTAGGSGPIISAASGGQGENTGCIFLGKVMQFGISGTDPEEFKVFSVAGLQKDSSGQEVTTYAAARPVVVEPSTATGKLQFGLTTREMYYGQVKTNVGAIAFVNSLAQYSSGAIVSGAQQVNVIPISNSALNANQTAAIQDVNANLANSTVNPSTGVKICFVSGGTDQSGLITIGSSGRQLSVTLSIKGNKTCA